MAKDDTSSTPYGNVYRHLYSVEFAGRRATYPESMTFVIGLSSTSKFVISSLRVSGKHCEIICSMDGWQLHNLTSVALGTLLNGKVITRDATVPLENEAILKLGNVFIQCRMEIEVVPFKVPMRVLKLQALLGEEYCALSPEPDTNVRSHPMSQDRLTQDDSIIEISPERRSLENESNENDSMSVESRGKRRIMKELQETKAILRKVLIRNAEVEIELSERDRSDRSSLNASSIYDYMEQEFQCSICNEVISGAVTLACSHSFCEVCLWEWKKNSKVCPLCRQPITSENKTRMLDSFIDTVMPHLSDDVQNKRMELTASRKAIKRPAPKRKRVAKRRRTRARPVVRVSVDYSTVMNDIIYISD